MQCRICHKEAERGANPMCRDCRASFGLPDRWPESRRLPHRCLRCGHGQFVRALIRERGAGDWYSRRLAPLAVTFPRQKVISVAGDSRPLNELDLREPIGLLEVYACRACGFTEWYTLEPDRIPIGPEYATELVDVGEQRR